MLASFPFSDISGGNGICKAKNPLLIDCYVKQWPIFKSLCGRLPLSFLPPLIRNCLEIGSHQRPIKLPRALIQFVSVLCFPRIQHQSHETLRRMTFALTLSLHDIMNNHLLLHDPDHVFLNFLCNPTR